MENIGTMTITLLTIIHLGSIALVISLIICYFKLCGRIKKIEELNEQQVENMKAMLQLGIMIKNKKD